jgi:hypothetical protein
MPDPGGTALAVPNLIGGQGLGDTGQPSQEARANESCGSMFLATQSHELLLRNARRAATTRTIRETEAEAVAYGQEAQPRHDRGRGSFRKQHGEDLSRTHRSSLRFTGRLEQWSER